MGNGRRLQRCIVYDDTLVINYRMAVTRAASRTKIQNTTYGMLDARWNQEVDQIRWSVSIKTTGSTRHPPPRPVWVRWRAIGRTCIRALSGVVPMPGESYSAVFNDSIFPAAALLPAAAADGGQSLFPVRRCTYLRLCVRASELKIWLAGRLLKHNGMIPRGLRSMIGGVDSVSTSRCITLHSHWGPGRISGSTAGVDGWGSAMIPGGDIGGRRCAISHGRLKI